MKSRKHNVPVKNVDAVKQANPELEYMVQEEETDAVCALLTRAANRDQCGLSSFAYPEEIEEADYVDKEALHRVVEDLQFGHDLRL